jgi:hypothetical protein
MKLVQIITAVCLLCLTVGGGVFWWRLESGAVAQSSQVEAAQRQEELEATLTAHTVVSLELEGGDYSFISQRKLNDPLVQAKIKEFRENGLPSVGPQR